MWRPEQHSQSAPDPGRVQAPEGPRAGEPGNRHGQPGPVPAAGHMGVKLSWQSARLLPGLSQYLDQSGELALGMAHRLENG